MTNNFYILTITIFLIMCGIIYVKWQNDRQFGEWFQHILEQAPFYGFSKEEISEFQDIMFWDYFLMELSPEEALIEYKRINQIL